MILSQNQVQRTLNRLKARLDSNAFLRQYSDELPLRSELFSTYQLERHAKALAERHEVDPMPGKDLLLPRLAENEAILQQANELLTEAAASNLRISPASEWLLDNFYKIEEQIVMAKRHLPKDYSKELPHMQRGPLAGYPRIYDIAKELILHTDGRLDAESLKSFVDAYQTITVLNLGELWAVAIMLRLALIENLRRISLRIAKGRIDRNLASYWADQVILTAETEPKSMIAVVADLAGSDPSMSCAFVAEFARRLEGQSHALSLPLMWIEERLSEKGKTIGQMVQEDIQQKAADKVSIGNNIASFRFLESMDWRKFVEGTSAVEKALHMDPDGTYSRMDFATRDRYRHAVERIARCSLHSEEKVALLAVKLAQESLEANGSEDRSAHVGFYLIDKGLPVLERAAGMSLSLLASLSRTIYQFPLLCYLGAITLVTALITASVLGLAYGLGSGGWVQVLAFLFLVICISSPAVGLVNWLATLLVRPHALPRMDFSSGIPKELRTLVVVPSVLTSPEKVMDLLEGVEVRYLANRDINLHFGLLTDLGDARQEVVPKDENLLLMARQGVEALNKKYHDSIFFLFPRQRSWDSKEEIWRGYERKRGILGELNSMLRGGSKNSFSSIAGDVSILPGIKYVITVDEDTKMPYDSARLLVETMAHPLNRPRFDEHKQSVVEGYSILHPRLSSGMPEADRSRFARLFAGEPGIDPYTREVSDVYQDIFGEGSFTGKGIYDVDAFSQSLGGRFPDNLILSHDLLEGSYARAALVSDVQFYEDYPYRYTTDVSRRHRWIRGDWQIASWLLMRVPGPGGLILDNPISALSRWKILDNLRRSLVTPAQILLLFSAWLMLPQPRFWTIVVIGAVLALPVLSCIRATLNKSVELPLDKHLHYAGRAIVRYLAQAGLSLTLLPYEAFFSLDAVVRTGGRMLFTRKRLLEWNSSSSTRNSGKSDLAGFYQSMWIAPTLAVALSSSLLFWRPDVLYFVWPLLLSWSFAPAVAWWISLPLASPRAKLDEGKTIFLRKLSRKTWKFFETFVLPEQHCLPPDNYQEDPRSVVANGTSPTNMGLSLLANLAAYDFGYISAGKLIERNACALHTMNCLERFQGHFYNWYDIKLLEPMQPKYISTVDSGNLAGHLLTVQQGIIELMDQKILPEQAFSGLQDTLQIIRDAASGGAGIADRDGRELVSSQLLAQIDLLWTELEAPPGNLSAAWQLLDGQAKAVALLRDRLGSDADDDLLWWTRSYELQLWDHLQDLVLMAPWFMLPMWIMGHPLPKEFPAHGSTEQEGRRVELQDELLRLDGIPLLREVPETARKLMPIIDQISSYFLGVDRQTESLWLQELASKTMDAEKRAGERIASIERLALDCGELADLKYDFLFDESRRLLAIGYNVDDSRRDESCYDLLASEARLCSYVAIAQGRLKQEHWFALGRMLTTAGGELALLSWGGTMFEYLMPLLIMPTYENTLLNQTYRSTVKRQIEYGQQRSVPWGISESGYNLIDVNQIYQYRAFGVPGLGFKRGLAKDLVIAPYASALALMVSPAESCINLQRMEDEGYLGEYGFYEAIDYTPSRLIHDQRSATVRSFMSHHQAMSFLAMAYVLLDRPMQRRFMANPIFQAADLLLQERVPMAKSFYPHAAEASPSIWRAGMPARERSMRVFNDPNSASPDVHLLSNGDYRVMISASGAGYSRWKDLAVTRWHGDITRDNEGQFFYIRDLDSNDVWSAGYQPVCKDAKTYQAIFQGSKAELQSKVLGIDAFTEVVVSPEDDVELRSISLTNRSSIRRKIELTSYAEVVLTTQAADATHPAFSNLFVETKILRKRSAILCTRRQRSKDERTPWMLHLMVAEKVERDLVSFETDRSKFIGRGRTVADPVAVTRVIELSDSEGFVSDPIVSIRCIVTIDPGETCRVNFITGMAETQERAIELIDKYSDVHMAERVHNLAWTHNQMIMQQLNITDVDINLYMRLASAIIYPCSNWRAGPDVLLSNQHGQSGLWAYGISGDLPIVLLRIKDLSYIGLAHQLLRAHAYWHMMGLAVDLVIWNEDRSGYRQELQDEIMGLISICTDTSTRERSGGVFVIHADQISEEAGVLVQAAARAIFTDDRGTFEEQLERESRLFAAVPLLKPEKIASVEDHKAIESSGRDLIFFNGLGGFTKDGREYIIRIAPGQATPAPWSNVIANPHFGTVISECGSAYTWGENSQQFRLTPWYNDPVSDCSGEALYIRDEESGAFWSPTALPARGKTAYTCRHGFGYSVFEHNESKIASELWVYVAVDAPVKFCRLVVRNESGIFRRLSVTSYIELVLGEMRSKTEMHVVTEIDSKTGAFFARNPYNTDFPGRIVFLDVNMEINSVTGDRTEFLGRNGSMVRPAALTQERLSNRVGVAMDPCAALQIKIDLEDGQECEIIFTCGTGHNVEDARRLIKRFRGSVPAQMALELVWSYWNHTLGAVHVETPDKAIDVLSNGWLLYQTLACRMWARSGYYQSSGAYGFRDQLQDAMALIFAKPRLFREHLLCCAAHQFLEGDVLHWWHSPSGRGVRTHSSDDRLWLPLATHRYVTITGDFGVLDERINFILGRPLRPEEEAYYDLPTRSEESGTLYEHCVRAIQSSLQLGRHGLPLMGTGDWNDAMNRVGYQGSGESIWMAFFLHDVLNKFSEIALMRGDDTFANLCRSESSHLRQKIKESGWDGHWYLRAYFDNGEPLGSAANAECRIDSISQSWSVLSGAGDPERSKEAMAEVDRLLVNRDASLIQLLGPPFDKSDSDPGYIKGYIPGVRENGGQYTHAAIWVIMAFAALGDSARAWELLDLINPVNHGSTPEQVATYGAEPYVVAADVYALPPHTGRGGWTWYTGAAGWMYRLIVESLLGLRLEVDTLRFAPCIPDDWKSFRLHYRYRETFFHITVTREGAAQSVTVDGQVQSDGSIHLVDDQREHFVEIMIA
ncbi:MAG: cyclic beta 1-2 glucan synthetase [Methanothrix sp.]|nr:cyclic beta 1-2 glucan synthetase [Methanothrix sp.]